MQFLGKLRHAGALLLAGTILTGCAINTGESHPDISAEPTADDGGSGDAAHESADAGVAGTPISAEPVIPPLGEFNRDSLEFNQFNPCIEIPEAFLMDVGLLERRPRQEFSDDEEVCTFNLEPKFEGSLLSLAGNDWGFEQYSYLSGEIQWSSTFEQEPILLYRDDWFGGIGCSAVVETKRGTFDVMFQSDRNEIVHDSCTEAERWLKLILDVDGQYGT